MPRFLVMVVLGLMGLGVGGCAGGGERVRVLTYNIHHGEGMDGRFDLERIAGVIRDSGADLVALQEVDRGTRRSSGVDQAAELGRLTGMHHAFGKAIDYQGGEYGEAVLSRWPIVEAVNHPLPAGEGKEKRAALAVRVRPGGGWGEMVFVGTHLDHTREPADRLAQIAEINVVFLKEDRPIVLAGDLNAEPGSEEMGELLRHWEDLSGDIGAGTWPADAPRKRIDYVLGRPAGRWRVVEARVIEEKVASDHRPVLVVLEKR